MLMYNSLSRTVDANSAIWMELRKQLEMAKIEEHKKLVSVTVLSPAEAPARRYGPRLAFNLALAIILAGLVSVFGLMIRDQVSGSGS